MCDLPSSTLLTTPTKFSRFPTNFERFQREQQTYKLGKHPTVHPGTLQAAAGILSPHLEVGTQAEAEIPVVAETPAVRQGTLAAVALPFPQPQGIRAVAPLLPETLLLLEEETLESLPEAQDHLHRLRVHQARSPCLQVWISLVLRSGLKMLLRLLLLLVRKCPVGMKGQREGARRRSRRQCECRGRW